jgi:hypothetical protein
MTTNSRTWFRYCGTFCASALLAGCSPVTEAPKQDNAAADISMTSETGASESGTADTGAAVVDSTPRSPDKGSDVVSVGSSAAPYIGKSKNLVAVPSIALPGKLTVEKGCLIVVSSDGSRATAIFPGSANTEMDGKLLVAISSEGKRYPLNSTIPLPGGGIDRGDVQLVEPVPSTCPDTLYGIGG